MENLQHLYLIGCRYFASLPILPPKLTHLEIDEFNPVFTNFPSSITHLKIAYGCEKLENGLLSQNITHLNIGHSFNGELDYLPQQLIYLVFGSAFNQPIDKLPPNLIFVQFGAKFNQPINNLPKSVKYLKFYEYAKYQQQINKLPHQLEMLILGIYKFPLPASIIPNSLKILHFSCGFNSPIDFSSIASLVYLSLGGDFDQPVDGLLPPNLDVLYVSMYSFKLQNL